MLKLSHRPNRADEVGDWKGEKLIVRIGGQWKRQGLVSLLGPPIMSFLPLKTSTNGGVKIHHARCVQHQLHSNKSSKGARWAFYKDITPRDTTKCLSHLHQQNQHQCPPIHKEQLKCANIIHAGGGTKTTQDLIIDQFGRDVDGTRQKANVDGGCGPKPPSSTTDSSHKPEARSGPLVRHTAQGLRFSFKKK